MSKSPYGKYDSNDVVTLGHLLCNALRRGDDEKRVRMLAELKEGAASRDVATLTRSLDVCADVTLGDYADHSSHIRLVARSFRNAIVALPPANHHDWKVISDIFDGKYAMHAIAEAASLAVPDLDLKPRRPAPPQPDEDEVDLRYVHNDDELSFF